jgi:hypothetical protein
MTEHDAVRQLLADRGCPEELVRGGLPMLAEKWGAVVASVEGGYPFGLDDYLNDMDLRDAIAGALAVATPDEKAAVTSTVDALDRRLQAASAASACLWGEDVEEDDGLDPRREWWYYVRPLQLNEDFAAELAAWGLLDDEAMDGDGDNQADGNAGGTNDERDSA